MSYLGKLTFLVGLVKIGLLEKTKEKLEDMVTKQKGTNGDKTVISAVIGVDNVPRYFDWRNYGRMIFLL